MTVTNENGSSKELADNERDTYFMAQINLPPSKNYSFSWRRLWSFTGPGFLMSIAYLDPGNIESDLQAGVVADYKLLWVLLYSTILGLLMQTLSARIGVVTGKHLAELCYSRYPKVPRILLWIMTEIAIIGSDMQEVIGTSVAIYMLSVRNIPLWAGCLITILDTFSFLLLDKYGLRKLEAFFAFLIATMAITFGFEFFTASPEIDQIGRGIAIPYCQDCNKDTLVQAVSIVGAIIMPHNLYLHSALVKSRKVDNRKVEETKDANRYVLIEASVALFISFLINLSVTSVFAKGLFGQTNENIFGLCHERGNASFIDYNVIENNTHLFDADLYKAGIFLGCRFGAWPYYVWAIGILAAGQSSTMTGTYSGQFAMEGFLNLNWPRWKRVLLTRTIAIAPTLVVTLTSNLDRLSDLNDYLNALMVIQLPFAILPTLTFSSSTLVMGTFANNLFNRTVATVLSIAVVFINIYFVVQTVLEIDSNFIIIIYTIAGIYGVCYVIFVVYLVGCYVDVLGFKQLRKTPMIGKYFAESDKMEYKYVETKPVQSLSNSVYE